MSHFQIVLVSIAGLTALLVLGSLLWKSGLLQRSPAGETTKGGDPVSRKAANDHYFAMLEYARVNAPESIKCLTSFHQHFAEAGLDKPQSGETGGGK